MRKTNIVNFRIQREERDRLEQLARERRQTRSEVIREALRVIYANRQKAERHADQAA